MNTEKMVSNEQELQLRLAKKVLFEGFEVECYEDDSRENGDFFMTRKQIVEVLGYQDSKSFDKVIERKRDKIGNSVHYKLSGTDGKFYNTELYSFYQLFEIIDGSRQTKAHLFRQWAIATINELVTGRAELKFKNTQDMFNYKSDIQAMLMEYHTSIKSTIENEISIPLNNKIISLESHILNNNKVIDIANEHNSLLQNKLTKLEETVTTISNKFKISYNKSALFERLKVDFLSFVNYSDTTNYNKFYDNLDNWLGITVPRKGTNTKQWILKNIEMSVIEEFVNGVIIGRIVKSKKGNWVDLSGIYENQVEWEKILRSFDYKCSYCGSPSDKLVGEHIICQSNKNSSDRIENLICGCPSCNYSKYNNNITEWYKKQSFFTEERWDAICNHYKIYTVDMSKI